MLRTFAHFYANRRTVLFVVDAFVLLVAYFALMHAIAIDPPDMRNEMRAGR